MPTKLILIILQHEIDSFPLRMEFTVSDLFIPSQWNCLSPTDKASFGTWLNSQVISGTIVNCIDTGSKTTFGQEIYQRI